APPHVPPEGGARHAEQASILEGGSVQVDVAIEVRDPEGLCPPVGPLVRWVLGPGDGPLRVGELPHQRVVDRHERMSQALSDGRQKLWVHNGRSKRGKALQQSTVGPVILLPPLDFTITVPAAATRDRLLLHHLASTPQRLKLLPV